MFSVWARVQVAVVRSLADGDVDGGDSGDGACLRLLRRVCRSDTGSGCGGVCSGDTAATVAEDFGGGVGSGCCAGSGDCVVRVWVCVLSFTVFSPTTQCM